MDGRIEWVCDHGVGHGNHIHGCCGYGCCSRVDYPPNIERNLNPTKKDIKKRVSNYKSRKTRGTNPYEEET